MIENEILDFINGFKKFNKEAIETTFTNGYWFAFILSERFNGEIVMDIYGEHFMCKINDQLYDITGKIECNKVKVFEEYKYEDPLHYKRLLRDCVYKKDDDNGIKV